jgi:hypothetical protein
MFHLSLLVSKKVSTFLPRPTKARGAYNSTRDLLQHHYHSMHEGQDEATLDIDASDFQRRAIACKACAKAKAKCDHAVRFN